MPQVNEYSWFTMSLKFFFMFAFISIILNFLIFLNLKKLNSMSLFYFELL